MTDTTARVITGIAAGAAALSMLVAYLTYRRLRPRVVIELKTLASLDGAYTADGRTQVVAGMRLVNRSASTARVEGFWLRLKLETQGATYPGGIEKRTSGRGRYELEEPLVIAPMDGVKVEARFDQGRMNLYSFPVDSGQIQAVLSNGRRIQRKLSWSDVASLRAAYSKARE